MKSWGTDVIPKEKWINVSKNYTCNGKRVIDLKIKLKNSEGREVTYPVKGVVVEREKPFIGRYTIWTLDGKSDICFPNSKYDLQEV